MNHFLNRYKNKTDSELKNILKNKGQYVKDAIIAASEILQSRNIIIKDIEKIKIIEKAPSSEFISSPNTIFELLLYFVKWFFIIIFFPLSLIFVAYYKKQKKSIEI